MLHASTGSTFVDITARAAGGTAVRIQTVDTLPDGVSAQKDRIEKKLGVLMAIVSR